MKAKRLFVLFLIVLAGLPLSFCKKEVTIQAVSDSSEVPLLPETPIDYPVSQNDYLAALGRVLFYDKELSGNKNISCGSCHQQSHAFTDNLQFSPGTNNVHTARNTPSIFARNGRLFWDGRANSLQDLVFRPVRDPVEMNTPNIQELMERIASLDYYTYMFDYAFGKRDKGTLKVDSNMIKMALSEFLFNFNFSNNKFNKSKRNEIELTPSEQLGKTLFFDKAKCSSCHHIDGTMGGNNGGYGSTNENHNIGLDSYNTDLGVGKITRQKQDEGAFVMPVLLNIEYTSPYMHDGRFTTLEQVVEHYNSEIKDNPNLDPILRTSGHLSPPIRMNLSETEKKGLVDFLKTLSDPSILTDQRYSDPFVKRSS